MNAQMCDNGPYSKTVAGRCWKHRTDDLTHPSYTLIPTGGSREG